MNFTASAVQAGVIPRSVEIGRWALCASVGRIEDPPSPSKIVVPRVASGGTVCTRASGEEKMTGNRDNVGGGKQKLTLSPHSWKDIIQARTSITAPAVARNGLPKMTCTWELSSISKTTKSHGTTELTN